VSYSNHSNSSCTDTRKSERHGPHGTKSHVNGTSTLAGVHNCLAIPYVWSSDSCLLCPGEVHSGEGVTSQSQSGRALTLQQDRLPTCESINILPQDTDPESMRYRTKLRSVLRRVMELERRLGGEKSLRRERIQFGLEVSVAGERGVWAPGFPFMMVFLAFITMIIPYAYRYYASPT
jgi:hypothetical protein